MSRRDFRCGGVVTPATTREELRRRGWKEEAIDEVMDMQEYLEAKEAGEFDGTYEDWRTSNQSEDPDDPT